MMVRLSSDRKPVDQSRGTREVGDGDIGDSGRERCNGVMLRLGVPETPKEPDEGICCCRMVLVLSSLSEKQWMVMTSRSAEPKLSATNTVRALISSRAPQPKGPRPLERKGRKRLVTMPSFQCPIPRNRPRLLRREALKPKRPVPRSPNKPRARRSGWAGVQIRRGQRLVTASLSLFRSAMSQPGRDALGLGW